MLLTVSGADTLLLCTAFALMFTPSGAAYALDARRTRLRRGDGPADPIVAPWGFRLIQIQLTILYFMTGLLKARGTTWADGSALYYVLSDPEFRRASFGLTAYPALMNALTFGALLLELALPFLLWVRAARPFVIPAGVMLHAGIIATVNIPVFSELCVATYLLFLTGGEWAAIARVFARSGRRRRVTRVDTPSATYRGPHALRRAKREATSSIPAPHIMSDAAVYVGNDVGS